jgi:hypothetical protein
MLKIYLPTVFDNKFFPVAINIQVGSGTVINLSPGSGSVIRIYGSGSERNIFRSGTLRNNFLFILTFRRYLKHTGIFLQKFMLRILIDSICSF